MIIDDILSWIETLPRWQKELSYLIINKKNIDEQTIDDIYEIFKVEMSLKEGSISENTFSVNLGKQDEVHKILWKGVGHLHGVNRLKSDEKLDVSQALTLIYGENGSGKSGYTRLLNRAFISRGDQEILGNVYLSQKEEVSANFTFEVDGEKVDLSYPDEKEEYPFKTIRNFDSKSAFSDMSEESVIDFAPSELSFFDKLLENSLLIQKKLDEEREKRKIDNPILKYFPKDGEALNQMKVLSANTKVETIKKKFAIDASEKEKYERIKVEKASLIALDINKQIAQLDDIIEILKNVTKKCNKFCELISSENINKYNEQISFLNKWQSINNKYGLDLFKEDNIEFIGKTEWKEFIKTAKIYYDKISEHKKCPLCGNKIDDKDLIFKYWKFLESDSENNYKFAKEAIHHSKEALVDIDLSFLVKSSIHEQWLLDNFEKETKFISDFFIESDKYRNQLIKKLEEGSLIVDKFEATEPDFIALINRIVAKKENLNQESINKKISEYTIFEDKYTDKIKVCELMPTVTNYIDYLKWDAAVQKSKINTRGITNKQKELFAKYVTDDYLKAFSEECTKLNANFDIEIVSRGKSGQTLKKLQIKGNAPGKVLSEGEQRAISIANFLTEVQMDEKNIGIVLDDPVSSLDHKRRTEIVNRLLEEACKRQVIIFTHEIAFFLEIKTGAEKKGISFQQQTIRKISNEPGNISNIIPWYGMNVKARTGKLKDDLQKITSIYKSGDEDAYFYEAKKWCELLRESWERAVEEILFNDAVQRYNPCIQTQKLKKAPFSLELYDELDKGMTECSAWCHDQARAINGNIPGIEDLKAYIECFENYCKKHRV